MLLLGGGTFIQTYHDIDRYLAKVDPNYWHCLDLGVLRSFSDLLSRSYKAEVVWPSFCATVLAFHGKIWDCYHNSVWALQSQVELLMSHELTIWELDHPEDITPFVKGIVEALQCLAIDRELERDKMTYARFERSVRRLLEESRLCKRVHIVGRRFGPQSTQQVLKNMWSQMVVSIRTLSGFVFEHAPPTFTPANHSDGPPIEVSELAGGASPLSSMCKPMLDSASNVLPPESSSTRSLQAYTCPTVDDQSGNTLLSSKPLNSLSFGSRKGAISKSDILEFQLIQRGGSEDCGTRRAGTVAVTARGYDHTSADLWCGLKWHPSSQQEPSSVAFTQRLGTKDLNTPQANDCLEVSLILPSSIRNHFLMDSNQSTASELLPRNSTNLRDVDVNLVSLSQARELTGSECTTLLPHFSSPLPWGTPRKFIEPAEEYSNCSLALPDDCQVRWTYLNPGIRVLSDRQPSLVNSINMTESEVRRKGPETDGIDVTARVKCRTELLPICPSTTAPPTARSLEVLDVSLLSHKPSAVNVTGLPTPSYMGFSSASLLRSNSPALGGLETKIQVTSGTSRIVQICDSTESSPSNRLIWDTQPHHIGHSISETNGNVPATSKLTLVQPSTTCYSSTLTLDGTPAWNLSKPRGRHWPTRSSSEQRSQIDPGHNTPNCVDPSSINALLAGSNLPLLLAGLASSWLQRPLSSLRLVVSHASLGDQLNPTLKPQAGHASIPLERWPVEHIPAEAMLKDPNKSNFNSLRIQTQHSSEGGIHNPKAVLLCRQVSPSSLKHLVVESLCLRLVGSLCLTGSASVGRRANSINEPLTQGPTRIAASFGDPQRLDDVQPALLRSFDCEEHDISGSRPSISLLERQEELTPGGWNKVLRGDGLDGVGLVTQNHYEISHSSFPNGTPTRQPPSSSPTLSRDSSLRSLKLPRYNTSSLCLPSSVHRLLPLKMTVNLKLGRPPLRPRQSDLDDWDSRPVIPVVECEETQSELWRGYWEVWVSQEVWSFHPLAPVAYGNTEFTPTHLSHILAPFKLSSAVLPSTGCHISFQLVQRTKTITCTSEVSDALSKPLSLTTYVSEAQAQLQPSSMAQMSDGLPSSLLNLAPSMLTHAPPSASTLFVPASQESQYGSWRVNPHNPASESSLKYLQSVDREPANLIPSWILSIQRMPSPSIKREAFFCDHNTVTQTSGYSRDKPQSMNSTHVTERFGCSAWSREHFSLCAPAHLSNNHFNKLAVHPLSGGTIKLANLCLEDGYPDVDTLGSLQIGVQLQTLVHRWFHGHSESSLSPCYALTLPRGSDQFFAGPCLTWY
ncbi:hypothetical protein JAAARDRAFT_50078 [Jaapia argillacea MUCL 33604]|uniref:Uncharacterized protein n=1 Tax=Jaapia argillacea MUCL 33604 TaxID=933084 RepID=A0A067PG90_9AGAM|nr:hypothetical protein JAAARDRAFT_50078 [Jaapia argillacea MUCL 33604]